MFTELFGGKHESKYANDVQVSYNVIEFKLRFRFISDLGAETAADIVMHPMIMKAGIEFIQKELAAFEKAHGTIYLPTDVAGLESLFRGPVKTEEERNE